ncbi:MAG: DNA primase small subunit domain-containing protein, partial [Candidatus ainarchaeum sp.]|nr:DNA primase small subunit domain-containing protein [Candidatus ainarchaeum sp.]
MKNAGKSTRWAITKKPFLPSRKSLGKRRKLLRNFNPEKMILMDEQEFLKKHFADFYKKNFISDPPEPETREFGIGEFGRKITQRHLSFSSAGGFNAFLQKEAPFFVSYSTALYKKPSARPMQAKEFFAGDIVYEFDADDIKTPCKQVHDSWKCPKCNAEGKGAIELCTQCGTPVKVEQWFCEECLGEAKKQTLELREFLENDFSITDGISINFSGSAGFHFHLRGEAIRQLSQPARMELLDFLTGTNLNLEAIGFMENKKALECPFPSALGWGKKLLSGLKELLENAPSEKIAAIAGVRDSKVKEFLEHKKKIFENMEKGILYPFTTKKSREFWLSLVTFVREEKSLDIDRQTSMDLNKIIRVPGTIHGGTGFIAKKLDW